MVLIKEHFSTTIMNADMGEAAFQMLWCELHLKYANFQLTLSFEILLESKSQTNLLRLCSHLSYLWAARAPFLQHLQSARCIIIILHARFHSPASRRSALSWQDRCGRGGARMREWKAHWLVSEFGLHFKMTGQKNELQNNSRFGLTL